VFIVEAGWLAGDRRVRVARLVVTRIELFALDASVSGDLLRRLGCFGAREHAAGRDPAVDEADESERPSNGIGSLTIPRLAQ
jgi:hypothetical protein